MVDGTADDDDIATLHCHVQTFDNAVIVAQGLATFEVSETMELVLHVAIALGGEEPQHGRAPQTNQLPRHHRDCERECE